MFKKYSGYLITLLLLCNLPEHIFAQTQDPITFYSEVYEGNKTIKVDQCDNFANYINRISFGERDGSTFRFARFWISFGDGCKYDLTNGENYCNYCFVPNPFSNCTPSNQNQYQTYWNKVMRISTDQRLGDKNSIRLGWRYNPKTEKIELGFYAHLNHLGEGAGEQGREFKSLGVFTNTNLYERIEMALGKWGAYIGSREKTVIIVRDVFSWDPDGGQNTDVQANAYVGDPDQYKAPEDMEFYIFDLRLDGDHQALKRTRCGDNIEFIDSKFDGGTPIGNPTYSASNTLTAPVRIDVPAQAERLPYTTPFCVIEPGANVTFTAGSQIKLKHGFHAKQGSRFHAYIAPAYGCPEFYAKKDDNPNNDTSLIHKKPTVAKEKTKKPTIQQPVEYFNQLLQNYPNPASTTTDIMYSIKDASTVSITLYNIYGQKVGHLVDALRQEAGTYKITMDATNLAYGVYFYTMEVQGAREVYKETKRMVVLR